MGDRGNIHVKDGDSDVFLYTHWRGSDVPDIVRDALERRQRWDDGPYLTRILFDTLTAGEAGGETGFGISSNLTDGRVTVVDILNQTVDGIPFEEYLGRRIPSGS